MCELCRCRMKFHPKKILFWDEEIFLKVWVQIECFLMKTKCVEKKCIHSKSGKRYGQGWFIVLDLRIFGKNTAVRCRRKDYQLMAMSTGRFQIDKNEFHTEYVIRVRWLKSLLGEHNIKISEQFWWTEYRGHYDTLHYLTRTISQFVLNQILSRNVYD